MFFLRYNHSFIVSFSKFCASAEYITIANIDGARSRRGEVLHIFFFKSKSTWLYSIVDLCCCMHDKYADVNSLFADYSVQPVGFGDLKKQILRIILSFKLECQ